MNKLDEKKIVSEIRRLKDEMDKNRNDLLAARGFTRSAEPSGTSEGIALWNQLDPETQKRYDRAAAGTGLPGSGIFFLGYREKAA